MNIISKIFLPISLLIPFSSLAGTVSLLPTVDQTLRDFDLDGYYESELPESGNQLSETLRLKHADDTIEVRSALEFDLSSIPDNAVIDSAIFSFTIVGRESDDNFEVHGYVGDGSIDSSDMNISNIIFGPERVTDIPITHSIDATDLALSAMASDYIGFMARMGYCDHNQCSIQIASKEFSTFPSYRPSLTVSYSVTPVPIPPTGILLLSGILCLIRYGNNRTST